MAKDGLTQFHYRALRSDGSMRIKVWIAMPRLLDLGQCVNCPWVIRPMATAKIAPRSARARRDQLTTKAIGPNSASNDFSSSWVVSTRPALMSASPSPIAVDAMVVDIGGGYVMDDYKMEKDLR